MMVLLLPSLLALQLAPPPPQIRVVGRATVTVAAERASVRFGVVTEAGEAQAAVRANAEKLDAAIEALRDALGETVKLETSAYSLQPVYDRPEPREAPVLRGYTATNVLEASDLPLDAVGRAIDVATSSGANSIQGIEFGLRDESAPKLEALRRAATDARAKAETLAQALGLRLQGILEVSEGEADVVPPRPMFRAEMAMAQADVPTPVEAGAIEIRASVTLVVLVEP